MENCKWLYLSSEMDCRNEIDPVGVRVRFKFLWGVVGVVLVMCRFWGKSIKRSAGWLSFTWRRKEVSN